VEATVDLADEVGWIVGERGDGNYIYGCFEHADGSIQAQPHRLILREEAEHVGAICDECGLELWEVS
jgi:hypothetical protein